MKFSNEDGGCSTVTITSSINKFKSNEERPPMSLTFLILHIAAASSRLKEVEVEVLRKFVQVL